eukprot:3279010-Rhodomonas_salina.1
MGAPRWNWIYQGVGIPSGLSKCSVALRDNKTQNKTTRRMQRDRSTIQKARGELGLGGEVHSRLQRRALVACSRNQVPDTPEWEDWIT